MINKTGKAWNENYESHSEHHFIWTERIDKLESRLKMWKYRNLSLTGKVLILNTLGLSDLHGDSLSNTQTMFEQSQHFSLQFPLVGQKRDDQAWGSLSPYQQGGGGSGSYRPLHKIGGSTIQKHTDHDPIDPGSKMGLSSTVLDRPNPYQIFELMGILTE